MAVQLMPHMDLDLEDNSIHIPRENIFISRGISLIYLSNQN
jgi:hypothetical protein